MPRWPDIAAQDSTSNTSGSVADHMYVVVHTADGSYAGTIAWQKNRAASVSSHFVVAKDGRTTQMLDTNAKAWTQIAGNPYSISVENEGNENTPLTPQQIEANARILARAHQVHGIPLQLTGHVGTRGLGHHSMGAESGVNWGHSQCPGSIIKGQKAAILARAIQIVGGAPPTPQGDDMPLTPQDLVAIWTHDLVDGPGTGMAYKLINQLVADTAAIKAALGVAQADLDDIQARVGGITLTDAQVQTFAHELNLTPDVITAAARKAIDARLDDDATT